MKSLSQKIETRVRHLTERLNTAKEAGADQKEIAAITDKLSVYEFARALGYELERWGKVEPAGNALALSNYIAMKDEMRLLLLKHGWDG